MKVSPRARVMLMLLASAAAILTCGTHYSVSAWSPELKHKFNCTQSEISAIGELGGMSSYLSPLSGVVVYALPEWMVSVIVLCCSVIGYIFMSLAVQASPGDAMYPLRNPRALGILFCLQGFGSFTLYKLGLVVNVHNMPVARRGSAVALLASFLGISASVFTLIYNGPLESDVAGILLVMGLSVMGMALLCAVFVRRVDPVEAWGAEAAGVLPGVDSDAERPMLSTHGSFMIPPPVSERDDMGGDATGYLRMPAASQQQLDEELMYGSTNTTSAMGLETPLSRMPTDKLIEREPVFDTEEQRLQYEAGRQEREQLECQATTFGGGLAGQVFGAIWFLIRTRTYWVMLIVFILVAGINQTGHIVQALNGGEQDGNLTTMLILLLSLSNASGRLLMGLSDIVPIRKGWWLVGVCAFMSLTHFANAYIFVRKELVIFGVIGIGLSYGGLWAILPIIVSEYFGPINFSMNLGWISFASGLGGLFCNHYTGVFYDHHVIPGTHDCVGPECFRYGFILCGCAAALGMLFSLPLVPLTQRGRKHVPIKAVI